MAQSQCLKNWMDLIMSDIRHDKKVTVELDRSYVTNGYAHGHVDGDVRKAFTGKTEVTEDIAQDLAARQKVWADYDASRHRDNGSQIAAGNLSGGGN